MGVALVLFILGVLGWLVINGRALSRAFKEDLEVNVDFHDNVSDESVAKMKAILDKQQFVRSTPYHHQGGSYKNGKPGGRW